MPRSLKPCGDTAGYAYHKRKHSCRSSFQTSNGRKKNQHESSLNPEKVKTAAHLMSRRCGLAEDAVKASQTR